MLEDFVAFGLFTMVPDIIKKLKSKFQNVDRLIIQILEHMIWNDRCKIWSQTKRRGERGRVFT